MNDIIEKDKNESDTFIELNKQINHQPNRRIKVTPLIYKNGDPMIVIGPQCKILIIKGHSLFAFLLLLLL